MHGIARRAVPALLVAAPLAARAEEPAPFRIGVGGSIDVGGLAIAGEDQFAFVPSGFANVLVPMWIGNLRVEPELGLLRLDRELTTTLNDESDTETFDTSAFRMGATVAWSWEIAERTRVYAGPRFGVTFWNSERTEPLAAGSDEREVVTVTSTDFWIGATVGGEAFLTPAFSLGVEAQLNYVGLGDPETEVKPAPEPTPGFDFETSTDDSMVSTQVVVSARVYFL